MVALLKPLKVMENAKAVKNSCPIVMNVVTQTNVQNVLLASRLLQKINASVHQTCFQNKISA